MINHSHFGVREKDLRDIFAKEGLGNDRSEMLKELRRQEIVYQATEKIKDKYE